MLGLCQAILNENANEIEGNFDVAVSNYLQKCKLPLYSTRSTLIFYEYLKCKSLYREANVALIRSTSEVSRHFFLIILFYL